MAFKASLDGSSRPQILWFCAAADASHALLVVNLLQPH